MTNRELQTELLAIAQGSALPQSVDRLRGQIEQLSLLTSQQNAQVRENTEALIQNTVSKGSAASNALNATKNVASMFGVGMLVSPIISGIAKLFGGGKREEPPPLVPFAKPASISLEAAVAGTGNQYTAFDYNQMGQPRRLAPSMSQEVATNSNGSGVTQNVTIQIQALDSRSILDRSEDIAGALKEAMLNSHSVNGLINEL